MSKTALITGGAKGMARKTAEKLAESGCHMVINYRSNQAEAAAFAEFLTECYGVQVEIVQGDVSNKEDCEKIAAFTMEVLQGADILVHNAGPYIQERKPMAEYTWEEWNQLLSGNLTAVFYLTKLLLPSMREKKWGRIVTFGYDRVETTPAWQNRSAFAAAKAGLASLTKTIAIEEAAYGITANMICPGDIIEKWKNKNIAEAQSAYAPAVPVGRPGTGEDIARILSFLISEESSFITGAIIPVTGGQDVLGKQNRL